MTNAIAPSLSPNPMRLWRSLQSLLGPDCEILSAQERPWASVTFSGARHIFALRMPLATATAPDPDAIAALPDHQFALAGEIVADCIVSGSSRHCDERGRHWLACSVEILTITTE